MRSAWFWEQQQLLYLLAPKAREGTSSRREPGSPRSCSTANVTLPLVFFSRSLTVKQGEKAEVSPAALRTA